MSPLACKNINGPHCCVLDVGHPGPHQAYRSFPVGGPLLMAEWDEHITKTADPTRLAGFMLDTSTRPRGLDTPIAMKMAQEAIQNEIDDCVKRIQEGHNQLTYGIVPKESHDLEKRVEDLAKEWASSSAPGQLFGLDRSEHSVRLSAEPYRGPRRPAFAGPQHAAVPGLIYERWNSPTNDSIIVFAVDELTESGRFMKIEGELWTRLSRATNAPLGEVGLTNDDLETLFRSNLIDVFTFELQAEESPFVDESRRRASAYHDLKEELFFTDPEVLAHVCTQVDVPNVEASYFSDKVRAGLELAWVRAMQGRQPEHAMMVRSAHRASLMVRKRWFKQ